MFIAGIKAAWASIPSIFKNKYVITLLAFGIWITFFDDTSLLVQRSLSQVESGLHERQQYYKQQISEIELAHQTLEADPERYARERYLMKRADEDVFIIIHEK